MKKTTKGKKTLPKIEIGSYHAGGIVFYIDETGEHGLVMAPIEGFESLTDEYDYIVAEPTQWGPMGLDVPGTSKGLGSGRSNTDLILAATPGIETAASVCRDLNLNGYNDWYLPSRDDLSLMYQNVHTQNLGNFSYQFYWSSSQSYTGSAWALHFGTGNFYQSSSKTSVNVQVRAVRAF